MPRYSEPAEAIRPRIVSISGSPAATSEPNASTRMTERDRPGDQLGLHHRRAVGRVEVRPHARRAGQRDLHAVALQPVQLGLEVVGGADHRVGVRRGAGLDDRGVAVARDRRAGLRRRRRTSRASRPSASRCARRPSAGRPGRSTVLSRSARRPSGRWRTGPGSSCRWPCARRPTPSRWPPSRRPTAPSRPSGRRSRGRRRRRTQAITTARKCVAVQWPRRPIGPNVGHREASPCGVQGGAQAERAAEDQRRRAGAEQRRRATG